METRLRALSPKVGAVLFKLPPQLGKALPHAQPFFDQATRPLDEGYADPTKLLV